MPKHQFILTGETIEGWDLAAIRFKEPHDSLILKVDGFIANSVDPNSGRLKEWKRTVAKVSKEKRGSLKWDEDRLYAISLGFSFHMLSHGNNPNLDVENFMKPVLDGLAAGLFCGDNVDPMLLDKFDANDSNFRHLFVSRLPDAKKKEEEGVAFFVSCPGRNSKQKPPPKYDSLMKSLVRFAHEFRPTNLPPLKISELYDLFPCKPNTCPLTVSEKWPGVWPNSALSGVYVIFSEMLDVLYVGKASMGNSIGARLSSYFGNEENESCRIKHKEWSQTPRYVLTIAVPDESPFEAPAIEEFLIAEVVPPDNTVGKLHS